MIFLLNENINHKSLNVVKPKLETKCLPRIVVSNCINITLTGVGCILRNLESVVSLSYDKLADVVETVAKIDPDFIQGRRSLKITHLDQFSEYYDFSAHGDMVQIILRVCPRLDSLR